MQLVFMINSDLAVLLFGGILAFVLYAAMRRMLQVLTMNLLPRLLE